MENNQEEEKVICWLKTNGKCKQDCGGTRIEFDKCMDEMEMLGLI